MIEVPVPENAPTRSRQSRPGFVRVAAIQSRPYPGSPRIRLRMNRHRCTKDSITTDGPIGGWLYGGCMKIGQEWLNPRTTSRQMPVSNDENALERVKGIEPSYSAWKTAFDEIMATAVKRQHEPQRIVGHLLNAEINEKQAPLNQVPANHRQAAVDQRRRGLPKFDWLADQPDAGQ